MFPVNIFGWTATTIRLQGFQAWRWHLFSSRSVYQKSSAVVTPGSNMSQQFKKTALNDFYNILTPYLTQGV